MIRQHRVWLLLGRLWHVCVQIVFLHCQHYSRLKTSLRISEWCFRERQDIWSKAYDFRPIEASVVLLPMYEFLRANPLFTTVLLEDLVSPPADVGQSSPLPCTLIRFTSYLCSHASSTSSPRSMGYANLSLNTLLSLVENGVVMEFMTQTSITAIPLCRQVGTINSKLLSC